MQSEAKAEGSAVHVPAVKVKIFISHHHTLTPALPPSAPASDLDPMRGPRHGSSNGVAQAAAGVELQDNPGTAGESMLAGTTANPPVHFSKQALQRGT